ncbi:MAG: ribbon-helix-helix domain-containing protein [Promethearchaeota archaeon]
MRLITCHLPEYFLDALNELVRSGRYPNRSEAIRCAIRDFLRDEIWALKCGAEANGLVSDDTIERVLEALTDRRR